MKKITLFGLMIACACVFSVEASTPEAPHGYTMDNYLTITWLWNPFGIGCKVPLYKNIYAAPSMEYNNTDRDLMIQLGGVYMIPREVIIFNFYVGSGLEFSRNHGYQYPYITVGTNFLFLYTEITHPLRSHEEPKFRLGISVRF